MERIGQLDCRVFDRPNATATLVLMHGRGTSADDLFSLGEHLPPHIRAVFPQAPYPFPFDGPMQFGYAWYGMSPEEGPHLEESATRIESLLRELVGDDPKKAGRVVLGGFSQGGVMTLHTGFRFRPQLAGLLCMSGYLFDADRALSKAHAPWPPVCLVHGIEDEVVDVRRARRAREALDEHGVVADYAEFNMGHTISGESWQFVLDFLATVLPA